MIRTIKKKKQIKSYELNRMKEKTKKVSITV